VRATARIIYRVILGLAGLSVGILQAIVSTKALSWSPWTVVSIASCVGGVIFLDNMRLLRSNFQSAERHAARTSMQAALITALHLTSKEKSVDLLSLGGSVFSLRKHWTMRRWVLPIPWLPWHEERLHRILRCRLSDRPQESDVRWTRGKGTIGECWDQNVPILHDRRRAAARYGRGHHPDESVFSHLRPDQHCGFTREEFIQTIDKYGEVLAVPIVKPHSGQLIGVLSIDCRADAYPSVDSTSVLAGASIEEFAIRAARLVRDDVSRF
jgi:hypothetical protein